MLNLIFGIIIDSYAELRDEQHIRYQNRQTICFVCGVDKSDFDKKRKDFYYHINKQHNQFKYIFFVNHLHHMNSEDLTTVETEIWQKYKDQNTDWIPFGATLSLGEVTTEKTEFETLSEKVDGMKEQMNNLENMMGKIIQMNAANLRNQLGEQFDRQPQSALI